MDTEDKKGQETKRRCFSCGSYECYYTKGYMRFNREKVGYCRRCDKITGNKDTCDDWNSNLYKRRRMGSISIKALNETIVSLTEVTEIIKEDIEHKHLHYLARERLEKKLNELETELADKSEV